jgi:phosphoserine phosphatase
MKIRAAIVDFDGTIVTEDISDELCGLVGKKEESRRLNQQFHEGKLFGLASLVQRINFLTGLSLAQIQAVVEKNQYLRPGARELFEYFHDNHIISIIASGNIIPLLESYQKILGADYLVGSRPLIKDGRIVSIAEDHYSGLDFKVRDSQKILTSLGIAPAAVVAIGDSPADKGIFEIAGLSIAVDAKHGVEKFADFSIPKDLSDAIKIIDNYIA